MWMYQHGPHSWQHGLWADKCDTAFFPTALLPHERPWNRVEYTTRYKTTWMVY